MNDQDVKVYDKAERYDEMVESMREVVKVTRDLNMEERNLLSVAHKNVIGSRRASWRNKGKIMVAASDDRESDEGRSSIELMDSPGHVEFSSEVAAALGVTGRACGRGRGRGRGDEESEEWQPFVKLGGLDQAGKMDSLEDTCICGLSIGESEIVDHFLPDVKDGVLSVHPVREQTRAGERTGVEAVVAVRDGHGHVRLGVECARGGDARFELESCESVMIEIEESRGKSEKAGGTSAIVVSHSTDARETETRPPSGQRRILSERGRATIGIVADGGHVEKPMLKAGHAFHNYEAKLGANATLGVSFAEAKAHTFKEVMETGDEVYHRRKAVVKREYGMDVYNVDIEEVDIPKGDRPNKKWKRPSLFDYVSAFPGIDNSTSTGGGKKGIGKFMVTPPKQ